MYYESDHNTSCHVALVYVMHTAERSQCQKEIRENVDESIILSQPRKTEKRSADAEKEIREGPSQQLTHVMSFSQAQLCPVFQFF